MQSLRQTEKRFITFIFYFSVFEIKSLLHPLNTLEYATLLSACLPATAFSRRTKYRLEQQTELRLPSHNVLLPNHSGQKRPIGKSVARRSLGRQKTRPEASLHHRHLLFRRYNRQSRRPTRPPRLGSFTSWSRKDLQSSSQIFEKGL